MRLYLSSFQLGNARDRLVELLDGGGEVAVVANALDGAPYDVRRERVAADIDRLAAIGVAGAELDLRNYFGDAERLESDLRGSRGVWIRGGNVFVLRYAMACSGADTALTRMIREDALVYAGYSAAGCVLAPSLRGLELCDSPAEVASAYGAEPVWGGLGVLDRPFVPHLDSPGHPESEALAEVSRRYARAGVEHHCLRDGQVLIVDTDTSEWAVR